MSFLTRLDELMERKGINRAQLSRETGIPYTTINSFYHKGYENVRLSTLKKLAEYFNCSLDYLIDDEIQGNFSFDEATEYLENRLNQVHTIAAHHKGEEWTDEELNEIEEFKKFVLSKRDQKDPEK